MDYMTLKEASERWGVSARQINYYCAGGRIPGAVKMATIWLIPKDAEKTRDKRYKNYKFEADEKAEADANEGEPIHEENFDCRR